MPDSAEALNRIKSMLLDGGFSPSDDRARMIKTGAALEYAMPALSEVSGDVTAVLAMILDRMMAAYGAGQALPAPFASAANEALAATLIFLEDPARACCLRRAGEALASACGISSSGLSRSEEKCRHGGCLEEFARLQHPLPFQSGSVFGIEDAAAQLLKVDATDKRAMTSLAEKLIALSENYPEEVGGLLRDAAIRVASMPPDAGKAPAALAAAAALVARASSAASALRPGDKAVKEEEQSSELALPADVDLGLVQDFLTESREYLSTAESSLMSLELSPGDSEALNAVFRSFHTVKGMAAFLNLTSISGLSHAAENMLSTLRSGEQAFSKEHADLLLASVDMLKELTGGVKAVLEGRRFSVPEPYAGLHRRLLEVSGSAVKASVPVPEPAVSVPEITIPPRVQEISSTVAIPEPEAVLEQEEHLPEPHPSAPVPAARPQLLRDSSVRVRTDRLDRLIDEIGELVIAHTMIAQDPVVDGGLCPELYKKVAQAGKIVRDLQSLSMSMRMVPLKASFQKVARLVRDLADKSQKPCDLKISGEDTEIDRNMVDALDEFMVHMVRNSMDHGLEPVEERVSRGKPARGTIKVSAAHEGGMVVFSIEDDGKGLDAEKILQRAVERGLTQPDAVLSSHEIYNFIFTPGFSTADRITDISGRGVGMDVVRKGVENMRGRIDIETEKGSGTRFRIKLPLTLAVTDGMLVRVGGQVYILPTHNIRTSLQPRESDLSTVQGRGELVRVQGELLPLFRLSRIFGIDGAQENPVKGLLVVVEDSDGSCALLVDELLGQQQVVAKALGNGVGAVEGVAGGAILGNGQVGLILDVSGLSGLARALTAV